MKYVLFFVLVVSSLFLVANASKEDEKWVTILINQQQGVAHDLDAASIKRITDNQFTFVHRMRLKNPAPSTNGMPFDSIVIFSVADCKSRISKMLADILFLGDSPIAKNVLSEDDTASIPEDGSVHSLIMQYACKKSGIDI